jgi:5-methylcytosine-specific restriction endonuclease McrA
MGKIGLFSRAIPKRIGSRVMRRDGGKCFYCGKPATCIDHVIPFSVSANNDPQNLVAACRECNSIVHTKTFDCIQDKRSWILEHLKDQQRVTELENFAPKHLSCATVSRKRSRVAHSI